MPKRFLKTRNLFYFRESIIAYPMKKVFTTLTLLVCMFANAQEVSIIPQPTSLQVNEGSFNISAKTNLQIKSAGQQKAANFLNKYLQEFYGFQLKVTVGTGAKNAISLVNTNGNAPKGTYTLVSSSNGVAIKGANEEGVFYGVQSLIQLLPIQKSASLNIPAVSIQDQPRFVYRGMHLDEGRHFFGMDFVKKYIDFIAMYKLNTFHWHLTEDQGWRIEIKKYPKLTSVGGFRNANIIGRYPGKGSNNTRYGGYYTQAQIKEIVKYAADRFVTIIPEIEMPGHASAAIAAYPELSCFPNESTPAIPTMHSAATLEALKKPGTKIVQETWGVFDDVFVPSENTFTFLQNVLDEVIALFPSTYIHIGGDECPKESWKRSEFCQNLIKEKGLKDEHGLQSYFIGRIEKYLNSKGRQIIGWDEILEGGLAPNATVMSWRGEKGGIEAAKEKHTVIMTPGGWMYFDHQQNKKEDSVTIGGYTTIQKVYSYEPLPKEMDPADHKYVLGAQANVWSEYMNNTAKVEYMVFPRMSALSEVLWTSKENKSWPAFEKKLLHEFKRYDNFKINYSKAYFNPENN
jgi:hexosaminidase